MPLDKLGLLLLILVLTVLSGIGDSQGFIHAAAIWQDGKLIWIELGKSALGFGIGILTYWIAVRSMRDVGLVTPEIQTLIWFVVTLLGVALASGNFLRWYWGDQVVAAGVLVGVGWLLVRTAQAG